ncbi:hypothetical protein [Caballeronia sp. GAWG2-1]|uniref:hypothetical protein n=1 Tax=Caballeronia sp. GAWG2-1 TaxID=2921744 RepID=UPI002029739B|nr:hypothetical protein [Caballeronia sp. GAWG2-1]
MNTRDDETIAAEADLRELLATMINKPLIEKLDSALGGLGFTINKATRVATDNLAQKIDKIGQNQERFAEDVDDKLDEFSGKALATIEQGPAAIASKLSPGLTSLNDEQRALSETQRLIAQEHQALNAALDEARKASVGQAIQLAEQMSRLEARYVGLTQCTGLQIDRLEQKQQKNQSLAEARFSAIETSLVSVYGQGSAIRKVLYGGLALSTVTLVLVAFDISVRFVR